MTRNNRVKRHLNRIKKRRDARKDGLSLQHKCRLNRRHHEVEKASAFITNLSDHELTDDEILALSKGLGFVPTPNKPKKSAIMKDCNAFIRTMRIRFIAATNRWPKTHKFRLPSKWNPGPTRNCKLEDFFENLKEEISKVPIKNAKFNYNSSMKKAWEDLKKNTNLILKGYDKGRGIAVISKEHYLQEGYRQLTNKDQYLKLDYNPTKDTTDMLHSLICEMHLRKQLDTALADYLDPCNGQMKTPVFFMLPKIHKKPPLGSRFVGRPVVSNCGSPLEKASEFLDFYLLPIVKSQPTYLKDTGDTIRKIEALSLPPNVILASLDIISMFTSVPQNEAFEVTLNTLANADPFLQDPIMPDIEYMAELLRLVLYRNAFEFNEEFFLQISGVPMGQKSSGSICNLVVHELENKILKLTPYIHTLYRYMDDTLVFWTGSLQQLKDFVNEINTLHETLKFTYEASETSIQFLDLVLYKGTRFKETGILDIKCHTKKTETGQFLHRTSSHPRSVFKGFLRGEIMRYARNNNNIDTFREKKEFFMQKLTNRGYTESELLDADLSINLGDRSTYIQEKPKSLEIPLVFKTTYFPHMSGKHIKNAIMKHWHMIGDHDHLKTIFPKPPIVAYSRTNSLRDTLVRAKLPRRKEEDSTYVDFIENDDLPPSSPTLIMLQELQAESRGFDNVLYLIDSDDDNLE